MKLGKARMRLIFLLLIMFINPGIFAQPLPLNSLHLPPGFHIEIYAAPLPDAREMTLGPNGVVFVSSSKAGHLYAIIPDPNTPHGTRVITLASGLNMPNGIAF